MTVEVKICGLSTTATLQTALEAGADYVGLVFYGPSPRNVSIAKARELAARARGKARVVALTVDADDNDLAEIVGAVDPDFIQAHGRETPQRVAEIVIQTGKPVIKAIKVRLPNHLEDGRAYDQSAFMLLYDAMPPDDDRNALPGGNGVAFDWSLLAKADVKRPFMLSGGLNAANVATAIAQTGAAIVDVSSGVESHPGEKDPQLIWNFIEAAKRAG